MKKNFPWGRCVVGLLAAVCFLVGFYFLPAWWDARTECADADRAEIASLTDPLGTTGTFETPFRPKYQFTCKEMLVIGCDPPVRTEEEIAPLVEGLRGELVIIDSAGKPVLEEPLNEERFRLRWVGGKSGEAAPALIFTPLPAGDYRLRLTVDEPARGLTGKPHRVVLRYGLCGLEYLCVFFHGIFTWGPLALGSLLGAGIVLYTRYEKRRLRKGTPSDVMPAEPRDLSSST